MKTTMPEVSTANQRWLDSSFRVAGRNILRVNWTAARVQNFYDEAWNRTFRGDFDPKPFKELPKQITDFLNDQLRNLYSATWNELWEEAVKVLPDELFRLRAEGLLEAAFEGEPLSNVAKVPISTPKATVKGSLHANALYRPPSAKDINVAVAKQDWAQRLKLSAKTQQIASESLKLQRKGLTPRAIAKDLAQQFNVSRSSAARIARTEAQRVNIIAQEASQRQAFGDVLQGWEYVATLDRRTRPAHAERDGTIYKDGELRPLLPDGPNCRCIYTVVTKSLSDLTKGTDLNPDIFDGLFGGDDFDPTGNVAKRPVYEDWFNKQSAGTKRSIVGKQNYAKLAKGGKPVTWDRFAQSPGSPAKKKPLHLIKDRAPGVKVPPKPKPKRPKPKSKPAPKEFSDWVFKQDDVGDLTENIDWWSENGSGEIAEALQETGKLPRRLRRRAKILEKMISRSPNFKQTVFRGTAVPEERLEAFLERFKPGNEVSLGRAPGVPKSATSSFKVAQHFTRRSAGRQERSPFVLRISQESGAPIEELVHPFAKAEREVLLSGDARYRVKKIIRDFDIPIIELEEIL